jgi:heme oxygenase (biliverdin-IX-beta and delta-forming)
MMQGNAPSMSLLQRLKQTTAQVHRRVEERLDVFSDHFDLARYVALLQRFYGFWAPIEENLQRFPELYNPALALHSRLKAHLLEADMRVFRIDSALVARCAHLPHIRTFGQALGCMYVLEGSTLGSQIIARHLTELFQIDSGSGAAFFNAYGGAIGARWSEFREFLISSTDASSADELLGAALETFERFDSWLAAGPPR